MKAYELLKFVDGLAKLTPSEILSHPAWCMPMKLGDASVSLRCDGAEYSNSICLKIRFADEECLLGLRPSPAMPDFSKLFPVVDAVPEPLLMAAVEKEAGSLLQLLENAVRKELSVIGIANRAGTFRSYRMLKDGSELISFELTSSKCVDEAFGDLRFLDTSHPSIADLELECDVEYASFDMQDDELAGLSQGDRIALPELLDETPARLVVKGTSQDRRCRVICGSTMKVRFAELANAEDQIKVAKGPDETMALIKEGTLIASGSRTMLGEMPAFEIESVAKHS